MVQNSIRVRTNMLKLMLIVTMIGLATPPGPLYTSHSGTITTQTWISGSTHFISADLTIADNNTLTIESGVIVKIAAGVTISVQGTLDVNGASGVDNDVLFTSMDDDSRGEMIDGSDGVPAAGDWDGIYLWGNDCCTYYDALASIDHSTIKYAGKSGANDAALLWSYDAHGSITNSIIEYSQTNGIWIYSSDSTLITIDNNTISNNGSYGVYANGFTRVQLTNNVLSNNTNKAAYLLRMEEATVTGNTGSGNGINGIEFYWFDLGYNSTWGTSSTLPIILNDVINVVDGITLTINAGSIIKGKTNSQLSVSGTLDANGTSESNIIFTSYKDDTYGGNTDTAEAAPAGGDWKGIIMYGETTYDGIGYLDYCRVRYGKGPEWGGTYGNVEFYKSDAGSFTNSISEYAGGAGITVDACSPTITGSTINNNGTYGIYVQGGTASAPVITNNSINNNANYAVYLNNILPTSYSGNSGSGNVPNRFGWYGTVSSSVTHSGSLPFELIYPVSISSGQTLTISSGTIYFGNHYVTGAGNFTLESGALMETKATDGIYSGTSYGCVVVEGTKTFSPGAKFLFDRGGTQYTGDIFPPTVAELSIANATPLTLTNNVTVTGILHMTSGILNTGSNTVTVGSSASMTGDVDAAGGTVNGTITRWFNTSTVSNNVFPVGTAAKYLPATVSFTDAPTTGGTITAKFFAVNPTDNGIPLDDGGTSIINCADEGYWSLTSGDGLSGGTYTLDLTTSAFAGVDDYTKLRIMKRTNSGSAWTVEGTHSAGTGSNSAAVAHRTGLTGFSEFAIGSSSENPLPVELTSFTGSTKNCAVILKWVTATETNNYGFEIERKANCQLSNDQITKFQNSDWQTVGFIHGHGTTDAPSEYIFTDKVTKAGSYSYRLRQTDRDGNFTYSPQVEVTITPAPSVFELEQNYPNPFNPTTTIWYRLASGGMTTLTVYDALGREAAVLVRSVLEAGEYSLQFDASHLASGTYLLRLASNGKEQSRKIVILK